MSMNDVWASAIGEWLMGLRAIGRPETTVRVRRQQLSQLATSGVNDDPWAVTLEQLEAYLGAQRWKPETRHAHRSALVRFYGWGRSRGYIEHDPTADLASVRRPPPMARPLPENHAAAALAAADERQALMVRLAGEHGLRRGEIALVHSRDLFADLAGYSLTVHGKGGRVRFVPIFDAAIAEAIRDADGWVFPGQVDGHLSPAWVGKLVQRVLPDGWTTHTLRHRFATQFYAQDRDVFATQAALGHASPATTLRYVQLPDDAVRRTMAGVRIAPARPQTPRLVVSTAAIRSRRRPA